MYFSSVHLWKNNIYNNNIYITPEMVSSVSSMVMKPRFI